VLRSIFKSTGAGWLNLDEWSTTYVGAHWLVTDQLPKNQWETSPRHAAFSQMVLLASHHLVEVMLFKCVRKILDASPGLHTSQEQEYTRAHFRKVLEKWPAILVGAQFDLAVEPFKSAVRLSERRNATTHKDSRVATLTMARSGLFSAVEASREIAHHLLGKNGFSYLKVLQKYPIEPQIWFSEIKFPEDQDMS
jgi:hypothetical protein